MRNDLFADPPIDAGDARLVLVAPDKFKGTFSAREVCELVGRGLQQSGFEALCAPMADGGEGTAEVLADALGGQRVVVDVIDALGRPTQAEYWVLEQADGVAVLDVSAASGLASLAIEDRDAIAATSYGTGSLIAHAARNGAQTIIVGIGGSATTDGGAGLLEALRGVAVPDLILACDVTTPWENAARVFSPQKGATPDQVRLLEARLDRIATDLPKDPRTVPMTGGGGGIAGALWAAHDGTLVSGAAMVWEMLGLDRHIERADIVITGEGRLDSQTKEGKVVAEVARRAEAGKVPCYGVVGSSALSDGDCRALGLERVVQASTRDDLVAAAASLLGN